MRGLGLGFTNSGGTWGKWDMCVGGVGEWVGGLGQGLGGCYLVMSVCVVSLGHFLHDTHGFYVSLSILHTFFL